MLDQMTQGATRICEALGLPYPTQVRIHDVLKAWNAHVFASSTTSTIAAAAVWSVVKDDTHVWLDGVPGKADIKVVAEAAGCAPNAIRVVLKKHA